MLNEGRSLVIHKHRYVEGLFLAMHIPAATLLDKPDLAGSQISTVYSATTERAIKPTLISLKSQEKYL